METGMQDKKYEDIILNFDEGNKACIDCRNTNVTHISINNAVILCPQCAEKHFNLGSSISYIRSINDEWDEYLFNFVIFGGNTKFSNLLKSFSIEETLDIEKKYQTKACDYYRRTLKAKVLGNPLDETIDSSSAKEMCAPSKNTPSEFDNYIIKTNNKGSQNPLMKVGDFFGQIGKKTWGEIKQAGQFVAKKTAPATNKIKQAGQFVAKKTAPATDKIKQGANFVSSQVMNAYTDVKDKIIGKKIDEENAIEVNINEGDNNILQEQQEDLKNANSDQFNQDNSKEKEVAVEQQKGAEQENNNEQQFPTKDQSE